MAERRRSHSAMLSSEGGYVLCGGRVANKNILTKREKDERTLSSYKKVPCTDLIPQLPLLLTAHHLEHLRQVVLVVLIVSSFAATAWLRLERRDRHEGVVCGGRRGVLFHRRGRVRVRGRGGGGGGERRLAGDGALARLAVPAHLDGGDRVRRSRTVKWSRDGRRTTTQKSENEFAGAGQLTSWGRCRAWRSSLRWTCSMCPSPSISPCSPPPPEKPPAPTPKKSYGALRSWVWASRRRFQGRTRRGADAGCSCASRGTRTRRGGEQEELGVENVVEVLGGAVGVWRDKDRLDHVTVDEHSVW
ncbi:hypothetical protein B0H19DRAFT_680690 [Mycena capillaripes]|nr:hypothetical protein B0H19DRAFT_680690 [Mycena capillaripes]